MIFIGLKAVEISGVIFIPYYIGYFVKQFEWVQINFGSGMPNWIAGLLLLVTLFFIAMLSIAFICVIQANWEKA